MRFTEAPLEGSFVIDLEKREDRRGFFARMFCETEFAEHGCETHFVQMNNSFNRVQGTLRGLHYQLPPFQETKLIRCVGGALHDLIVDLRPTSKTFKRWCAVELSLENRRMLYVPAGCAQGILTMEPDTEMIYLTSQPYAPGSERGIRWNDQAFNFQWPEVPAVLSDKDRGLPDFNLEEYLSLMTGTGKRG